MSDRNKQASPFLTTEEAASFLRVGARTLNNWRWAGKGPRFHKHGQRVVYHQDDLMAFSRPMNTHG